MSFSREKNPSHSLKLPFVNFTKKKKKSMNTVRSGYCIHEQAHRAPPSSGRSCTRWHPGSQPATLPEEDFPWGCLCLPYCSLVRAATIHCFPGQFPPKQKKNQVEKEQRRKRKKTKKPQASSIRLNSFQNSIQFKIGDTKNVWSS